MSDLGFKPWSNNPNAPKIPYSLYIIEKADFAGNLLAPILYGMLIVLFFKCMTALLNPVHRRGEGIKWGLVSYTVVMFSLATVDTAMNLNTESISHIDNRNFPGAAGVAPPGPIGYFESISLKAVNIVPNVAYVVSNWLADGFLLYRCYVIHSMNRWVIAFPCLMYLSSIVMGVLAVRSSGKTSTTPYIPYFSIPVSLNVFLTLMIVLRLVLHGRSVRAATGSWAGIGGLYKTIATMLIESCALFAVSSLFAIVALATKSKDGGLAIPILSEVQIIAPLLIIQRVANRSALTSTTTAKSVSSFRARSRGGLTGGSRALPSEHSMGPIGQRRTNPGEGGIGVETTVNFYRQKV